MKMSLSTRWFLWLSVAIAIFCIGQTLGMVWVEIREILHNEGALATELTEISVLLSISLCVFVIISGALWFISRKMVQPIRTIAESANRISSGLLQERVEGGLGSDEIGLLVSSINRAFDSYHDAVRRLDRFAGNAAHQLRTPLTSIRSLGEVCLQRNRAETE